METPINVGCLPSDDLLAEYWGPNVHSTPCTRIVHPTPVTGTLWSQGVAVAWEFVRKAGGSPARHPPPPGQPNQSRHLIPVSTAFAGAPTLEELSLVVHMGPGVCAVKPLTSLSRRTPLVLEPAFSQHPPSVGQGQYSPGHINNLTNREPGAYGLQSSHGGRVQHRKRGHSRAAAMRGARRGLDVPEDTVWSRRWCNHRVAHLKPVLNDTECQLSLKNK